MRPAPLLLLALVVALVAGGCDSASETSVLRAPGGLTPTAGAIEIRDENNTFLGVLGPGPGRSGLIGTRRPPLGDTGGGEGGALPLDFSVGPAYPNPFWRTVIFSVDLPRADHVSVFVVAANPPGATEPLATSEQGAWVYRPGGLPIVVLSDGPRTAGRHEVLWTPAETTGRAIPFGYYRIYVQTPYAIAWQDVLYTPDSPYDN
ncbi:MAG: hypothetical protein ABJF88_03090 [Rhodothermales bacterium]